MTYKPAYTKSCRQQPPRSKLAWSTQQASSMHLRHESSLLSTQLPFWTCIITLGK